MSACRQSGISHYVLPKFAKVELCKYFNVKRITSFAIDFTEFPASIKDAFRSELESFDQLIEPKTASL